MKSVEISIRRSVVPLPPSKRRDIIVIAYRNRRWRFSVSVYAQIDNMVIVIDIGCDFFGLMRVDISI